MCSFYSYFINGFDQVTYTDQMLNEQKMKDRYIDTQYLILASNWDDAPWLLGVSHNPLTLCNCGRFMLIVNFIFHFA